MPPIRRVREDEPVISWNIPRGERVSVLASMSDLILAGEREEKKKSVNLKTK